MIGFCVISLSYAKATHPVAMSKEKIDELTDRLNLLIRQHNESHHAILAIKRELVELKDSLSPSDLKAEKITADKEIKRETIVAETPKPEAETIVPKVPPKEKTPVSSGRNLEEFIGGNLISKIGIGILIIGVGLFVKYAIDNELLGPVARVIGGFGAGLGLVGLAYYFREKYQNYSGILLGGGLAILYFTTFAAYDLYGLIPKAAAFSLMLVYTAFGVFAAYIYNVQSIAVIGMVGAYAVPVLLSDGTGEVRNLLIYITIVNIGILTLAFRKYWRGLNIISFILTWGVLLAWLVDRYSSTEDFTTAIIFSTLFFLTFYVSHLAYKLIHLETFTWKDVVSLLANSFIFYAIGYALIDDVDGGDKWLGLFTLANALVHFAVTYIIYNRKLADRNLFFLTAGMVLSFLTLAIPVQLDGNWVTVIWVAEAVVLFWVGRSQKVLYYEVLAYIVSVLGFVSLLHDWGTGYSGSVYQDPEFFLTPVFNVWFLTSMLVVAAFGAMVWIQGKFDKTEVAKKWEGLQKLGMVLVFAMLVIASFGSVFPEINQYFTQKIINTKITIDGGDNYNYNLRNFIGFWGINYAFLYWAVFLLLNQRLWARRELHVVGLVASGLVLLAFIAGGIPNLYDLREFYQTQTPDQLFSRGPGYIWMRYICFAFLALNLWAVWRSVKQLDNPRLSIFTELALHFVALVVLSSELQHIAHMLQPDADSYILERKIRRVGFSVLWGVYALGLMIIGFWKKRQYVRVGSIVLFGVILVKVFIFDLDKTSLGNKTVIFLALGVLLLMISYLYQRYKDVILGDEHDAENKTIENNDESE